MGRLLAETQEVIESRHRWTTEITDRLRADQRRYTLVVLAAPAVLLVLLVGLSGLVVLRVLRPLARIERAVGALRAGDLQARCAMATDDELGDMARAIDASTEALAERSAALRASENTMRLVADNLPAYMSRVDAQERYTYVNGLVARAVGGEQAVLGRSLREVRGDTVYAIISPYVKRALAGEAVRLEFQDPEPGRTGWFESRYIPDLDDEGRPRGLFAITFDITEHKQAAAELAASRQRLKLVMDSVPALIGYIDRDRRYRLVNQAYAEWHRRPEAELLGQRVDEFYSPQEHALWDPHMERALGGQPAVFDLDVVRHGQARSLHVSYLPQADEGGQVEGFYVLAHDVTQLRRLERQLSTIMDASPLGMFHADRHGRCLYVNPAWLHIAGRTLPDSLGEGWLDVIHPDDRPTIEAAWTDALTRGQAQVTEHRYLRRDGSAVWVRGHAAMLWEAGQVTGFIGTVEDITERRRLDAELADRSEELARSNRELEQFAYVASHDLQEPLRMVNSYAQLLTRRHADQLDAKGREFLAFIEDGGQRAQALVTDLLSLARVHSRGLPMQTVSLQQVLDEVLRGLRMALRDSGASVVQDTPLPQLRADPRQLGQLLHNLLTNALKFRGQDAPVVHIAARPAAGGQWHIAIADNGIGIEPRFHERIFLMFQRLHLRNEYPGTGIGLAICKKVVERHGGTIGVDSTPGQGAAFWFTWPAAQEADA